MNTKPSNTIISVDSVEHALNILAFKLFGASIVIEPEVATEQSPPEKSVQEELEEARQDAARFAKTAMILGCQVTDLKTELKDLQEAKRDAVLWESSARKLGGRVEELETELKNVVTELGFWKKASDPTDRAGELLLQVKHLESHCSACREQVRSLEMGITNKEEIIQTLKRKLEDEDLAWKRQVVGLTAKAREAEERNIKLQRDFDNATDSALHWEATARYLGKQVEKLNVFLGKGIAEATPYLNNKIVALNSEIEKLQDELTKQNNQNAEVASLKAQLESANVDRDNYEASSRHYREETRLLRLKKAELEKFKGDTH